MVLTLTLIIAVIPTESEAEIYSDTVRLHILARSDTDEDQRVKLVIRDKLLSEYGERLGDYKNALEASAALEKLLPEIESYVNLWLSDLGCDYTCEVSLSKEWYGTRDYGDFTLPSGEYTSLRVMLGDAEGQNWWCVMFPPLCLDAASDGGSEKYTDSEEKLISGGGYKIKFKLLELASSTVKKLFGKG